jgi:hypothetical protein
LCYCAGGKARLAAAAAAGVQLIRTASIPSKPCIEALDFEMGVLLHLEGSLQQHVLAGIFVLGPQYTRRRTALAQAELALSLKCAMLLLSDAVCVAL